MVKKIEEKYFILSAFLFAIAFVILLMTLYPYYRWNSKKFIFGPPPSPLSLCPQSLLLPLLLVKKLSSLFRLRHRQNILAPRPNGSIVCPVQVYRNLSVKRIFSTGQKLTVSISKAPRYNISIAWIEFFAQDTRFVPRKMLISFVIPINLFHFSG